METIPGTDYISVALLQSNEDVNEGDFVLANEEDFIELDETSGHLGSFRPSEPAIDAENQQKVAQINIDKTTAGLKIREVIWGELDGHPACRVFLDLRITSTTRFRITAATLTCTVLPLDPSQHSGPPVTGQQPVPKILWFHPKDKISVRQGVKGTLVTATKTLDPEVNIGFAGLRIGSIARQRSYQPFLGIEVSGDDSFEDETILWSISNRTPKDRQTVYTLEAEIVVGHDGSDFRTRFELEAELDFEGRMKALGKNRPVARERNFRVGPSIGVLVINKDQK